MDAAVKDVSRRVAKLEMVNTDSAEIDMLDAISLVITTKGDYCLTIVFYAGSAVLRAITENMKREATTSNDEIVIYITEYFNILCGHIVTAMNRMASTSARFGIPEIVKGSYFSKEDSKKEECQEFFYHCPYGTVSLGTMYKCS